MINVVTLRPSAKKNTGARKSVVATVSQMLYKKYMQEMVLSGRVVTTLIDIESDISIMRASEYAMIRVTKNACIRYEILWSKSAKVLKS